MLITDEIGLGDDLHVDVGSTVADAGSGLTDEVTSVSEVALSRTDEVGVTDGVSISGNDFVTDSVGLTDEVSAGRLVHETVDDGVGVTDGFNTTVGLSSTVGDEAGVTDAVSVEVGLGWGSTVNDELGFTDGVTAGVGLSMSDDTGITDGVSDASGVPDSFDDTIGVVDFLHVAYGEVVAEAGVGVTDLDQYAIALESVSDDAVDLTDETAPAKGVNLNDEVEVSGEPQVDVPWGTSYALELEETVGLSDAVVARGALAYTRTVNEVVDLTEIVQADGPMPSRYPDDSTGLSDSVARAITHAVSDSESLTDAASLLKNPTIDDDIGLADVLKRLQAGRVDLLAVTDLINVIHSRAGLYQRIQSDEEVITDSISVIIGRVVTVSDALDVIDLIALSSPDLTLSVADVVDVTDQVEGVGWENKWVFITPHVSEHPIGGGRLFSFYRRNVGVSVLVTNGVATEKRNPAQEALESADAYYLGGHTYLISYEEGLTLLSNGYEDNLVLSQEKVLS